ncbi:hypothetical protein AABB24_026980, partial [Solanum stoloniferum]
KKHIECEETIATRIIIRTKQCAYQNGLMFNFDCFPFSFIMNVVQFHINNSQIFYHTNFPTSLSTPPKRQSLSFQKCKFYHLNCHKFQSITSMGHIAHGDFPIKKEEKKTLFDDAFVISRKVKEKNTTINQKTNLDKILLY